MNFQKTKHWLCLRPILSSYKILFLFLLASFFLLPTSNLFADVPARINYQGRLKESGLPFSGTKTMNFRLWNTASGGVWGVDGIWQTGDVSVAVSSGLFNYVLTPTPNVDWRGKTPYLEILLDAGAVTLTPREQVSASPYAIYAASAAYAFNAVGWAQTGNAVRSSDDNYFIGIGTNPLYGKLTIAGKDDQIIIFSTAADVNNRIWCIKADKDIGNTNSNRFEILTANDAWSSWQAGLQIWRSNENVTQVAFPNGNVRIGGGEAREKLEINGNVRIQGDIILDGRDIKQSSNTYTAWTSIMGGDSELGGAYIQLAGVQESAVADIKNGGAQIMISSANANAVSYFRITTREHFNTWPPMLIMNGNGKVGINTWDPYDALDLSTGAVRFYNVVNSSYTTIFGGGNGLSVYTSKLGMAAGGFLRVGEVWGGMGLFSGEGYPGLPGYNLGLMAPVGKDVGLAPNGGNPFIEGVYISTGIGNPSTRGVTMGIGTTANTANLYVVGTATITSNEHIGGNLTVGGTISASGGGGMITGNGIANQIPMFSGASTLITSTITESAGHLVGVKTNTPRYLFDVNGEIAANYLRLYNGDITNTQSYDKINISGGRNFMNGAMLELGGDETDATKGTDVKWGSAQIVISSAVATADSSIPMFRVRRRQGWLDLLVVKADGRVGILAGDPQAMLHLSSTTATANQYMVIISTANNATGYVFAVKGDGTTSMHGNVEGYVGGETTSRWTLSSTFGGTSNAGLGFGPGGATVLDTALWRNGVANLRTSVEILDKNVDDKFLKIVGGTSNNSSASLEIYSPNVSDWWAKSKLRVIIPQGSLTQGFDIVGCTSDGVGGWVWPSLVTISTSGVFYFGDSFSKQNMRADTVNGAIAFSSNVVVNGKVIVGNFATAASPPFTKGALFYDTTKKRLQIWDEGTLWVDISTGIGGTGAQGSGSINTVAKWTGSSTLGNSTISDDGTNVSLTGDMQVGGNDILDSSGGKKIIFSNGAATLNFTQIMSSSAVRGGWIKLYGDENTDNPSGVDLIVSTFPNVAGTHGRVRFVYTKNNGADWNQFGVFYANGGMSLGIPGTSWDNTGPGNGVIRLYGQHRIEGTDNVGPTEILGGNTYANGAYLDLFGTNAPAAANNASAAVVMPAGGKFRVQYFDGGSSYTNRLVVFANGGVRVGSTETDPLAGSLSAEYGIIAATAAFSSWLKVPSLTAPAGSYRVAFTTPIGAANISGTTGIISPAAGMIYYDNSATSNRLRMYNGAWVDIATGTLANTILRATYLGESNWITDTGNDGTIDITYGVKASTGIFSTFVQVGSTLSVTGGTILISPASADSTIPTGITDAVVKDQFSYGGKYINHYGFGIIDFNDGRFSGRNAYVSGYPGVNIFTGGVNRFHINQAGDIFFGFDNGTTVSTYTYASGDLLLANYLYLGKQNKRYVSDDSTSYAVKISTHLNVTGALKNVATKIVAANDTPNKGVRADYVCDNTDDQNEINAAIDALSAKGGVVFLQEGTYTLSGNILLDQNNVSLIGSGPGTIITGNNTILASAVSRVVLSNMAISPTGSALAVDFSGVSSGTVSNCTISGAGGDGIKFEGNSTNCLAKDNKFVGTAGGSGFAIDGGNSISVIGNELFGFAYSIWTSNSPKNLNITGNTFIRSSSHGLNLDGVTESNITGNTIKGCGTGSANQWGLYANSTCSDCIISGNVFVGNGGSGGKGAIYLNGSVRMAITGNSVSGNANDSIKVEDGSLYISLTGNMVYGTGSGTGAGIVMNGDYCTVSGNTISNHWAGIGMWGANHNSITGNLTYNCDTGIYTDNTSNNNINSNNDTYGCVNFGDSGNGTFYGGGNRMPNGTWSGIYPSSNTTRYIYDEMGKGIVVSTALYVNGQLRVPNMGIGAATAVHIDANGLLMANTSSKRFKDNIKPLNENFASILMAEPKSFNYKNGGAKDIGFIAEEIDALGLKNLVNYDNQGKPYSLKYDKVPLYLLEVMKQQQKAIDVLQGQNKDLEERLRKLEKMNK